ncbi:MAG: hypothetical protein M0R03_21745 [Novosphingobium sp.]|nr:hypothetical protein [Novosphingobium sp.]
MHKQIFAFLSVLLLSSCALLDTGNHLYDRLYKGPKIEEQEQERLERQKANEQIKKERLLKETEEKDRIEQIKVAEEYVTYINSSSEELQSELGEYIKFENIDSFIEWLDIKKAFFQDKSNLELSQDFHIIFKLNSFIRNSIAELLSTSCKISSREYVKLLNQKAPERKQLYENLCAFEKEIKEVFGEIFDSCYQKEVTSFKEFLEEKYNRKIIESEFKTYQIKEALDFDGKLLRNYVSNTITEGSFYKLAFGNVFQSMENGFLLYYSFDAIKQEYLFYVESDKFYPEGYKFYQGWGINQYLILQADGLFTYNSLGGKKKVFKFKAIELDTDYSFLFGANAYEYSQYFEPYTPDAFQ